MRALIKMMLLIMCFSMNQSQARPTTVAEAQLPIVYTEDKPAAVVQANQPEFSIKLKSNPTTGYSWYLRSYDANLVQPVKHVYEAPANKKLIGASGYEIWTFRVKANGFLVPMQTAIRFVYTRPWEANGQAKQVVFEVATQQKN